MYSSSGAFQALVNEAVNDDMQAQCSVGDIYADETSDVYNVEKAVYWYKRAAEQGHSKAQWLLGASYSQGVGIEKNPEEAENWLQKSAGSGDADGQYALAGFYFMKPDIVKAKYWLEKAAEQEHEEAKVMLPKVLLLYDM